MDVGVEIELADANAFNVVRETLTRIGVPSKQGNVLYQSCHILHKRGCYYIVHFLEMFILDGKSSTLNDNDIARRNTICDLLQQWGLVKVLNPEQIKTPTAPMSQIKVITHKDKTNWTLVAKYTIGNKTNLVD
ncbi:MAG: translational repressor RegA [Candidatus Dormibacteria bacterium]